VTIDADPSLREPYRAEFQGPAPKVQAGDATVAIEFRRHGLPLFDRRPRAVTLTLNATVAWAIEASGGLAHVTANLDAVQLVGLEVNGGARALVLNLPRPWRTVPVRFDSGASGVAIHRPAGVSARVRVLGGAQNLTLDGQHFGAVGGEVVWQSPDYDAAAHRYDVAVRRGVKAVTLDTVKAAAGDDPADRMLVTVLFTDIVGSTERARELGDRRWRGLLDTHDELAGRLVGQWGGRLVKTTGDGILATFDGPGRAIGCATALREQLGEVGIRLRAGLHAGEVELRDGDVGGIAVHIAARVLAAAGAGEVVVSRTVRDLVVGSELVLEDRGSRRLRGVEGDWQLYAVTG
jgi:class 3 adenylate cyclase